MYVGVTFGHTASKGLTFSGFSFFIFNGRLLFNIIGIFFLVESTIMCSLAPARTSFLAAGDLLTANLMNTSVAIAPSGIL